MLKKLGIVTIALMLILQTASGFALAADNSNQYTVQSKVIVQAAQNWNYRYEYLTSEQLDSLLNVLGKSYFRWNEITDVKITLKDYTQDGVLDIAIVYTDIYNNKYLDIYTVRGNNTVKVFSGVGNKLDLGGKTFSISNIKYDGRYFYETYTYQWSQQKGTFLRIGYGKTYIRDYNSDYDDYYERPVKPINKDERISTVRAFLNARLNGKMDLATRYLSKSYKDTVSERELKNIVPYGKVTAIDIFESRRGDWVAVVMKDTWGKNHVFKFVPVEEKNEFGKYKISNIIEIPEAK
ncbi:MAG TPA: hypothetical protein GX534_09150 [Thermoanaerobacterales bacterium]|nr:hypothetical protein [Thermoanaerobacterales bacterium]